MMAAHWIQHAIQRPGALHRALHVPEGEKIPASKMAQAEDSNNPRVRREAALAHTLEGMHGRAMGGPVLPGKNYMVGEKGPEMLHMGMKGGSVTPTHMLRKLIMHKIGGVKRADAQPGNVSVAGVQRS